MFINASCPNLQPYFQASAQSIQLCRLQLQHLQPLIYPVYILEYTCNHPYIQCIFQNTHATTHITVYILEYTCNHSYIQCISQNTPATTHICSVYPRIHLQPLIYTMYILEYTCNHPYIQCLSWNTLATTHITSVYPRICLQPHIHTEYILE